MSEGALAAALSVIAGTTDVTSWLLLGGLFSAHVTGNIVVVAADLVDGVAPHAAQVLAIPAFIIVTAIATLVATALGRQRPRTEIMLLSTQAGLLILAWLLGLATDASSNPYGTLALVIGLCAVSAMAAQNALLHLCLSRPRTTAVMTGNIVAATIALVDIVRAWRNRTPALLERWRSTWPVIAGFFVGCLAGALTVTALSNGAAILPAALASLLLIWQAIAVRQPRATVSSQSEQSLR